MSQSSVIAFALLVGFIVFITIKGELTQYLNVLGINLNQSGANQQQQSASAAAPSLPGLPSLPPLG